MKHSQFWSMCFSGLIALGVSACQPKPAMVATPSVPASGENPLPTAAHVTTTVMAAPSYKVRWTFQTKAAIWGAPSLSDGTVYIGSDDGNLYAVEAQTGDLRWAFAAQGIIRSRPSTAEGLVYVSSDDGNLYAVDAHNGVMVWRTDIGNFLLRETREHPGISTAPNGWDNMQSSPVVVDNRVFVGSLDGKLYALDAATGNIEWTFQTGQKIRATPTVEAGIVYIGSWDEKTYAMDAQTGAQVWATSIGGQVQTTALVADDVVYTASRKASVVALNAQTGNLIYEFDYGNNRWVESSPAIRAGTIFIGSAGNKWIIGLDGLTGEVVTCFFSQTYLMSTLVIVNDTVLIGGLAFRDEAEGGLFMLKLVDGRFDDARQPDGFFPVQDSLQVEGNWSGIISSPVAEGKVVYFGGLDGKLYAIDLEP